MNGKIVVIDYGMGNIRSVAKALEKLGAVVVVSNKTSELNSADGLLLPGVGAFYQAMVNLNDLGLTPVIRNLMSDGKPLLGICLGMQLLLSSSEEGDPIGGLDIIKGKVVKFELSKIMPNTKIPHMGWNAVKQKPGSKFWQGIPDGTFYYFAHSFYTKPDDKTMVAGTTEYGMEYASVLNYGNVYGTQFHPEKSGPLGLRLLQNYVELVENVSRK
ncbi:MAG: imidazole glycerol phosphate synthase subunit HisH [Elusimicrobiota bacterium]